MIPGRMCHKTKGAAKRGGFQLGTKNILWNTTISNRATHGWADWNISGNKHYGATQIHTETINLNGEEGGSKFDPERNQSHASNKGIRPPIQASQDYQEGRDRYSPGVKWVWHTWYFVGFSCDVSLIHEMASHLPFLICVPMTHRLHLQIKFHGQVPQKKQTQHVSMHSPACYTSSSYEDRCRQDQLIVFSFQGICLIRP